MKPYTKTYMEAMGFTVADFIPCECCGAPSNSIHHIKPKSAFGSTKKHLQDDISNLIALCASCHNQVHNMDISLNEQIKEVAAKRKIAYHQNKLTRISAKH